jgi:cytolysin-activating lysine-acyltransferase
LAKKSSKASNGGKSQGAKPQSAVASGNLSAQRSTVSHLLGEMVWLLSRSRRHRATTIADLDWLLGPPIRHRQFRIFREKSKPVGFAVWGLVDAATDKRLSKGEGHIQPDQWKSGEIIWLVELVAPFATRENQMDRRMVADLVRGPFKGKSFRLMVTNPRTGKRQAASFKPSEAKGA